MFARGGIRTHEAEAVDLKSTPFDRSGTLAVYANFLLPQFMSAAPLTRFVNIAARNSKIDPIQGIEPCPPCIIQGILTIRPYRIVPTVGLEPTTIRLRAVRSTN